MIEDNETITDGNQAIFDQYLRVLPLVGELLDLCFLMVDTEKYLFIRSSSTYKVETAKTGSPFIKKGSAAVAMDERRRVVKVVDKAVAGTSVSFFSSSMPIYNDGGEVIGAITAVETIARQEAVHQMAVELSGAISTLASNTEEISAQSQEISGVSHELVEKVTNSVTRVRETSQVLDLIRNIAGQTNLLGLNAAIEAARVGDQGRGFGVVAQEIRKLADSTSESIKQIGHIINAVQADSEHNKDQLEHIGQAISQIASAVGDTANTVQQVSALAARLKEMADDMFNNH